METVQERTSEAGLVSKEATLDTRMQSDVIAAVRDAQEVEVPQQVDEGESEVEPVPLKVSIATREPSEHATPTQEARATTMMQGKTPTLPPSHDVTIVTARAASRRESLTIPDVDVRDEPQVARKLSSESLRPPTEVEAPVAALTPHDTVVVEGGQTMRGRTPVVTLTPAPGSSSSW